MDIHFGVVFVQKQLKLNCTSSVALTRRVTFSPGMAEFGVILVISNCPQTEVEKSKDTNTITNEM